MMYLRNLLTTSCLIAGLTACMPSLESNQPAAVQYVMHPYISEEKIVPFNTPVTITMMQPTVAEGLGSNRIATLESNRRLNYLSQSQWAGDTGDVIKQVMFTSLNRLDNVTAVYATNYSITADYKLQLDVANFQAEYADNAGVGTPSTHATIRFLLSDAKSGEIVRQAFYDTSRPADENTATAITASLETQLHEAIAAFINTL